MAPTKAESGTSCTDPIDLTSASPAGKKIAAGRVTKSKPAPKAKPDKKVNGDEQDGEGEVDGPAAKKKRGPPACLNCRKSKHKCLRIMACVRCTKAGVVCPGAGDEVGGDVAAAGGGGGKGKSNKACERCREKKAACVRKDTCVRCEQKGIECVVAPAA